MDIALLFGSIGVLAGGVLTDLLDWHWIFLVNLPVGIAVFALTLALLPGTRGQATGRVDVAGAITVTASLMIGETRAAAEPAQSVPAQWPAARVLRPGGVLTLIHRADRLAETLAILRGLASRLRSVTEQKHL